MAEIKFKPSVKPDLIVFGFILGLLILIIIIISIFNPAFLFALFGVIPVAFFIIIPFIFIIIGKLFTTYTITDNNEIIIHYSFLSTSTKVYRIDQITSVTQYQGFVNKMLGYGTVRFGIFGKSAFEPSNQNKRQINLSAEFSDIKEYELAFETISNYLGVDVKNEIYGQKPSITPNIVSLIFSALFFTAGLILLFAILGFAFMIIFPILMMLGGFIWFLSGLISYFRVKRTNYRFMERSFLVEHDFFFSRMREVVPYKRITNVESSRNIFSYALFKILKYRIYTGGDRDPVLYAVPDDKLLGNLFSYVVESDSNLINKKILHSVEKNIEQPELILKPGKSFFLGSLVRNMILIFIFIVLGIYLQNRFEALGYNLDTIFLSIGIFLALFYLILRYIIWKNISYELYNEKIVRVSGIFTMQRKEVFLRNIKYISMNRPFLFQKVLGEGTIHIFTAGTGWVDNSLQRIKYAPKYYKLLKQAVIEKD